MVPVFFDVEGIIYTDYVPSKTVNANYVKKALARPWFFQAEEAHHVIPRLVPAEGQSTGPHCRLIPGVPGGKRGQDDQPPSIFAGSCLRELSSILKGDVGAGWPPAFPGQLPEELTEGCLDHCPG